MWWGMKTREEWNSGNVAPERGDPTLTGFILRKLPRHVVEFGAVAELG